MGLINTTDLLCLQFLGTPARNFYHDLATSQKVTGMTTGTEQHDSSVVELWAMDL